MRLRRLMPLAVLLAAWFAASRLAGEMQLPDPLRTLQLLISTATHNDLILVQGGGAHGFAPHIFSTFWHVALAGSLGAILGFLFAALMNLYPATQDLGNGVIELGRTLPPLLFVPFASAALGVSDWVRFLAIGLYAALSISVYAAQAFRAISPQYREMARLLGASVVRSVLTVEVPACLPHLLGPLRWVFSFSLGISIVVEYLTADAGIGRVMKVVGVYSRADLITVGVVWTIVLAFLFDGLMLWIFSARLDWTDRKNLIRWISKEPTAANRRGRLV